MANVDFTPSFSIENTMEMASTELLNNLLEPETVTTPTEEVTKIEKEEKKKDAPKPETPKKEEEASPDPNELLSGLLDENEEEEEEEPKPKKVEKKEDEPEDEPETKVNQFTALSKDLFKLGVFSQEEGEEEVNISTPEAFLERFKVESQKKAVQEINDFIGQFGEDYQEAFQAIFVKGVNPKDYLKAYTNIQSFSEMDLTQEANQIAVIKQGLLEQGFEQEDLNTEIDRLKNYGDLEKVAERHHKVLVKKETQRLQQLEIQKQQELQQKAAYKQQYAENVQTVLQEKLKTKEFDGIPINPKLVSEIQDFLLTDKYKTASGDKLTEFDKSILDLKKPENHEKKVKFALLLKLIEKDPTLSTIQKAGVSKKSEGLFNELARQKKTTTSSKKEQPTSWWEK